MYLNELLNLDSKELNKLTKSEIVKTIIDHKWQWSNLNTSVKDAQAKLEEQRANERATKLALAGYLGIEVPEDDYSVKGVDKLCLLTLVGKVLKTKGMF